MVPISVSYLGDLRCEAVHGPSGVRLITDAP
ncbi:MAG TPA: osmotically inducible protein OsmC, partial [Planctomycetes bacterium]|nr:osmotically inducible protein OsmC [Planctomycetota bacterium]